MSQSDINLADLQKINPQKERLTRVRNKKTQKGLSHITLHVSLHFFVVTPLTAVRIRKWENHNHHHHQHYRSLIINLINKTAQETDKKVFIGLKVFRKRDLCKVLDIPFNIPIIHNSFAIFAVCISRRANKPPKTNDI